MSENKLEDTYKSTSFDGETKAFGHLSWTKLAFLMFLSMVFTYGPFSLFAPVPLIFGILLYGRAKSLATFTGLVVILGFLSLKIPAIASAFVAIYLLAYLNASLIAETIFRKVRPIKGLLISGGLLISLSLLLVFAYVGISKISISDQVLTFVTQSFESFKSQNTELLKAGGKEARELAILLENPKEVANDLLKWSFSFLFVGSFLGLWITLFLVLKRSLIWRQTVSYPYTIRDLVHIRLPEHVAWPLIVGLSLFLLGDQLGPAAEVIGGNILACLGVFYFFQGFGVFLDLLTHLKIFGFFRSVMVLLTMMTAWKVLVIVGVFDVWINFRRFFNNKKEGDIV